MSLISYCQTAVCRGRISHRILLTGRLRWNDLTASFTPDSLDICFAISCAANVVIGSRHVRIAATRLTTSRDLWSMGAGPAPAE